MRRLMSLLLITFLLVSLTPQVIALDNIIESQITTNTIDQRYAAIYKDKIVWEDWRNSHSDIYLYDLSTNTERRITTNNADQEKPSIYDDKIVWEDWRNAKANADGTIKNADIYMYNLKTNTETQLTSDPADQKYPAIHSDKIVFIDDRNGNDLYLYDLVTKTERRITNNNGLQWDPAIYGDKIVWEDNRNSNSDIYKYDLSTDTETQISTDNADQKNPAIYDNKIIWEDGRNNSWDIYLYDLSTNTESRVTNNNAYQGFATIYKNKIVYEDGRNGDVDNNGLNSNIDIYMYDLSTNTETQITDNQSIQWDPVIYENKIVYKDKRNGNWDIYMAKIPVLNNNPVANITSIAPNPAAQGQSVAFNCDSNDFDGSVAAYSWRSDRDGVLANSASFSSTTLSAGTHNIYLKVQDNDGAWSDEVSTQLTINLPISNNPGSGNLSGEVTTPPPAPDVNNQDQINKLNKQIKNLNKKIANLKKQLNRLTKKIKKATNVQKSAIKKKIKKIRLQKKVLKKKVAKLKKQVDELKQNQ